VPINDAGANQIIQFIAQNKNDEHFNKKNNGK
jgi:hypothetical protein